MITNKELIEKLQKLPLDAPVMYQYTGLYGDVEMDPDPSYNEFSGLICL